MEFVGWLAFSFVWFLFGGCCVGLFGIRGSVNVVCFLCL